MKHVSAILAIISAIVCTFLIIMFPVSYHLGILDTTNNKLSPINFIAITQTFHARVFNGGAWFSSHELPYMGSMRGIAASTNSIYYENGIAHEIRDRVWRIGEDYGYSRITYIGEQNEYVGRDIGFDFPGIYFRHFDWWRVERDDWTLMVSFWYPIILFAIAPVFWVFRQGRLRFKKP